MGLVAVTMWSIWNDRNKIINNEPIPDANIRSRWISSYLEEFLKANQKIDSHVISSSHQRRSLLNTVQGASSSQQTRPSLSNRWLPPPCNTWKLNTDISRVSSPSSIGVGLIFEIGMEISELHQIFLWISILRLTWLRLGPF